MVKRRFIGDIHGDFGAYLEIINDCEESVQVGDYGIGFKKNPVDLFDTEKHRFIRGNHDNPNILHCEPNWIPDGTVEGDTMFVGGATSIDKHHRVEGWDWWPNEVPSIKEASQFIDTYEKVKPRIMVTHDCPEFLTAHILNGSRKKRFYDPSIIRQAFDAMFEIHQPEYWIYGHWHVDFQEVVGKTQFICLNINTHVDIEVCSF